MKKFNTTLTRMAKEIPWKKSTKWKTPKLNSIKDKVSSIKNKSNKIKTIWQNLKPKLFEFFEDVIYAITLLDKLMTGLFRCLKRFVIVSFIVIMAVHLCHPDFATEHPVLYQWHNGWINLAEFLLKLFLKAYYSLFTGQWDFSLEANVTIREMWNAFVQWISNLEL